MASVSILRSQAGWFREGARGSNALLSDLTGTRHRPPEESGRTAQPWCLRTGSILGGSEGILLPSRRRGKRDYAPAGQAAPAERRTDRRDVSSRERNKPQAEDKLFDQNQGQVSAEGCSHRRTGRSEERL
jgi:hypothetical protein